MVFGTVSVVGLSFAGLSAFWLRRRVSKHWISPETNRSLNLDLGGQVVVITGGNVGLGYEAAIDLARRNARIVLGCRSTTKGQQAVEAIQTATGNAAVECLELDLASLESVRTFAATIKSKYEPSSIHSIILNAGVWVSMEQGEKTKDGFEVHFGVNHLAHLLLAQILKDHLAKSGDSRIVFIASSLLKSGKIDFGKQDFTYDGRTETASPDKCDRSDKKKKKKSFAPIGYCDSKLMNALTCRHLATMLPPNVSTYALCPGFCRSSLGRNVSFPWYKMMLIAPLFRLIQRTTVQGAQNIVFAVLQDKDKLKSGAMYQDGKIMEKETDYIDSLGSDAPKQLWDLSEKLLRR
jgi:NAD(P)-dependent dehydrogenase (short-subunit alcohol dehydrogenase family)